MINVLSLSLFPWAGGPTEGEQLITRNHQHRRRRHPRPTEPTPIITFPGDGEESSTTAKKIVAAALAKCEKPASNVLL